MPATTQLYMTVPVATATSLPAMSPATLGRQVLLPAPKNLGARRIWLFMSAIDHEPTQERCREPERERERERETEGEGEGGGVSM